MTDTASTSSALLADLLEVADAYIATATFRPGSNPESATSSRVFKDGKTLAALRSGAADLVTKRYAAALQWFSDNWPENATWPAEIDRPAAGAPAQAAE